MTSHKEGTANLSWTTLARDTVVDKVRGILLGAALGDAVGLATEFLTREQVLQVYGSETPMFAFGQDAAHPSAVPFHVDPHRARWTVGDFTDDTDQQLLILLSFLASGGTGVGPKDFASRLRTWIEQGLRCLDKPPCGVGQTTYKIVTNPTYETDPINTAQQYWERTGRKVAPNGAVMRTAIIGALLAPQGLEAVQSTTETIARTTHADPRCVISCTIVTTIIYEILTGSTASASLLRTIVDSAATRLYIHSEVNQLASNHGATKQGKKGRPGEEANEGSWTGKKKQKSKARGVAVSAAVEAGEKPDCKSELDRLCFPTSLKALTLDDRNGIGYTYRALGSGMWCLSQLMDSILKEEHRTPDRLAASFKSLITQLTMQGGDADTNCAVAGALMGCIVGYSGLPREWLEGLVHHNWLVSKVDAELELVGVSIGGGYDPALDEDVLLDGGKGFRTEEELERWMEEREEKVERVVREAQERDGEDIECLFM
ncbi:hypothetical protein HDV00_011002 [Rhizophlyctis rosea]|nr:hypothetical protein HDV00_011002 [Rhizophlyctis rosea]